MNYTTFTVKGKEYKAKINARGSVELERFLGTNPVNIILAMGETEEVPSLEKMLKIIQVAVATFMPSFKMNDAYDLYDDFIEEGNAMSDIVPIVLDIFKASGYLKKEEDEKNA